MKARWWLLLSALLFVSTPAAARGKIEARDAFRRGLQYYNLSDFDKALAGFKEAYLQYPDPTILFNIGQCQRQLGNKQEALRSYRAYLREATDPPNGDEVRALIRGLEQGVHDDEEAARRAKQESAAPHPEPARTAPVPAPTEPTATSLTASAPPRRKPVYRQWWLWTAVGAVVVGVGLGVGLGVAGTSTHFPSAAPSDGTIRF